MKHPLTTTFLLVLLFLVAQVVGLSLLTLNIHEISKSSSGDIVVTHDTTAMGDRPPLEGGQSALYLFTGVALGTILILALIKFKVFGLWKFWFLLAIWFSISIALGVILSRYVAIIVALLLALWKTFRPNPFVHNITEIFMYAGLAVLLAPIFTLYWMIVVLAVISIYDMIAVWYSKHMVTMAQAQAKSNLFAGLYIPKGSPVKDHAKHVPMSSNAHHAHAPAAPTQQSAAILGGGDIAFPLLFAGVVLDWLITGGMSKIQALYTSLIVPVVAAVALTLLFAFAKKDRYYPAMPFLSAGCLLGLAIIILI